MESELSLKENRSQVREEDCRASQEEGAAQRVGGFEVRKSLALGGTESRSRWLDGRVGEQEGTS